MKKRISTREVAALMGVCTQNINQKINRGHFPGAARCECGRSIMVPITDVEHEIEIREKRK